jgi:CRP-like cAMP-binding protein
MPGDFFGFSAAGKHHFAANVAVNGTVIARYPRRRLEGIADADPGLARLLRDIAFKAISRLQDRMLVLGRTTARQKVVAFLIEMAGRSSDHSAEGVLLPMSRYDIADYLAISVETVSRSLSDLKQGGIIRITNRRQIKIVDRTPLMEMVSSAGIGTAE